MTQRETFQGQDAGMKSLVAAVHTKGLPLTITVSVLAIQNLIAHSDGVHIGEGLK